MYKKNKKRRPKIGLALSGGAALGIAHIGAIKALKEHEIPIDCVSGTSAGSMAAVAVAFDVPLERMIKLSEKMNWFKVSRFGYSKLGLNSNKPVGKIMEEMVGKAKIEDAKIPLAIIATDIDTGEKIVFRKGSVSEAVMASTCLPGFYIPVEINERKMVDGGLVENLPLSPLGKMGADIRIGVDLERWEKFNETKNVLDVIVNSIGILRKPQYQLAPEKADVLIEPHLEKFSIVDFKKFDELMEKGYESAKIKIPEIKKLLRTRVPKPKTFLQKVSDIF